MSKAPQQKAVEDLDKMEASVELAALAKEIARHRKLYYQNALKLLPGLSRAGFPR